LRIHADFSSHLTPVASQSPVIQVEKEPIIGEEGFTVSNGKFLIPTPMGLDFPVRGLRSGTISTATDDGSGEVTLNTLTDHGLAEGDIVTVAGTANYNGVWPVSEIIDDNSFRIPTAYVANNAGTWSIGDYLLAGGNTDGYDLVSQGMARLLANFPMFGNVYFNPLLTDDHVDELDFTFTFYDPDGNTYTPRLQTGRETSAGADTGQYPTHTALLAANGTVTPARPGLMVSDAINIGPYTLDCDAVEVGTDEFMLWWHLYEFEVTHDIAADFGAQDGLNQPALRYVGEMDQEPAGFSAYISVDGGANWCAVGLLEPISFCVKSKSVLIAFKNTSSSKRYIASYALLF
jgi:hypothetical protein